MAAYFRQTGTLMQSAAVTGEARRRAFDGGISPPPKTEHCVGSRACRPAQIGAGKPTLDCYVFVSATATAFTTDSAGSNLPGDQGPWHYVRQAGEGELRRQEAQELMRALQTEGFAIISGVRRSKRLPALRFRHFRA